MKKVLAILLTFIGFSINTMGQTTSCKISGGQDGATVVASIVQVGDGFVQVSLENDGSFDVNVQIKITDSSKNPHSASGTTSGKAKRDQTTTIKVPVSSAKSGEKTDFYKISISGSRCN